MGVAECRVSIQSREAVGEVEPSLVAVDTRVVVVAEAIPLLDNAVGVVEVHLTLSRISTEVSLSELIDVIDEVCPEEVCYLRVILGDVGTCIPSCVYFEPREGKPVHRGSPSELPLVCMPVLDHVESLLPCG